jgi:hypothetical protein
MVDRIVAVDWSGDRSAAGQRKKIWAGVWTADVGRTHTNHRGEAATTDAPGPGGKVTLEGGRTRDELADWLVKMAAETPRMVVGIDCCFSFPAWFLAEHGCARVYDFWRAVTAGKGEEWLHRECADGRFWGVTGGERTGKRPAEFCGEGLRRMMRTTDWENKIAVRQEGGDAERAAKMFGITAKSPFQIGGSGSVGTGSLRAMPVLERLRAAGFRVGPFAGASFGAKDARPLLVEMYTRLLTGPVAKSNEAARRAYLAQKRKNDAAYAGLGRGVVAKACASEDAFDALVCCVEMMKRREEFTSLRATEDEVLRLEGITWRPGVQA